MKKQVTIKINETSTAFLRQGGFKGYVKDQGVLHWKEVIEEAATALNVRREILEMHFNGIMNIAIEGLEEDGRTRQLGEYFELALGVRGAFGSKGAKFDAADHKLRANLIPLRRLRKFSPHFQVSVDNKAPLVVLESLRSVSRPDQDGLVFGEPLLLKGRNLWNIPPESDRYDLPRRDVLRFSRPAHLPHRQRMDVFAGRHGDDAGLASRHDRCGHPAPASPMHPGGTEKQGRHRRCRPPVPPYRGADHPLTRLST